MCARRKKLCGVPISNNFETNVKTSSTAEATGEQRRKTEKREVSKTEKKESAEGEKKEREIYRISKKVVCSTYINMQQKYYINM